MAEVTKVDDRRRITLPREVGVSPGESVIIIDVRSYFLGIPIASDPLVSSGSWLNDARDVKELKSVAERSAEEDATGRAKRRGQT
jgi:bifunctional DNA-binding transcriptional regulator/antitoxin component of YhaV-PrlF toxin-antitoxin module